MTAKIVSESTVDVQAAIDQVLAAERAGHAALERARQEAGVMVSTAIEQAARIATRARERIARLHERSAARLQAELREFDRPTPVLPADIACGDELTKRLAERVARQLIAND